MQIQIVDSEAKIVEELFNLARFIKNYIVIQILRSKTRAFVELSHM